MVLIINGEARQIPSLVHVGELAAWLELPTFGSAIELNGEVVRKTLYDTTPLKEGDCLEIVRLVGGG